MTITINAKAFDAGFAFAGAKAAACATVLELSKTMTPDDIKVSFTIGAIAKSLIKKGVTVSKATIEATAIFSKKGDKRRAAGLRAWSHISLATGVKGTEARGRKAGVKVGKPNKVGKAKVIKAAPKVNDGASAIAHVRNMALMLATFCKKNEAVIPADLSSLVADFVAKANKLA